MKPLSQAPEIEQLQMRIRSMFGRGKITVEQYTQLKVLLNGFTNYCYNLDKPKEYRDGADK